MPQSSTNGDTSWNFSHGTQESENPGGSQSRRGLLTRKSQQANSAAAKNSTAPAALPTDNLPASLIAEAEAALAARPDNLHGFGYGIRPDHAPDVREVATAIAFLRLLEQRATSGATPRA